MYMTSGLILCLWPLFWLPTGLEAIGKAMRLPQDKQKLATGKALIKVFLHALNQLRLTTAGLETYLSTHLKNGNYLREYCVQDVCN